MAGDGPLIHGPIAQLSLRVHDALNAHDFEGAFLAINATMSRAVETALKRGIFSFGSAEVDDLCQLVGRRWLDTHRPDRKGVASPSRTSDLYIASILGESGGHTALIGDFIQSMPARRAILAVTNLTNEPDNLPRTILRRASKLRISTPIVK